MKRSVLIVEDSDTQREELARILTARGWNVTPAALGRVALSALEKDPTLGAMLLDLRLPDMDGFEILEEAERKGIRLPALFVVSAFLDNDAWARLQSFKVQGIIPKPHSAEMLPQVLDAYFNGDEASLARIATRVVGEEKKFYIIEDHDTRMYAYSPNSPPTIGQVAPVRRQRLHETTRNRENALREYVRSCATSECTYVPDALEPLLLVARRWNSWYPSYFEVDGGVYAVVCCQKVQGNCADLQIQARKRRIGGALVDPGFRAVAALRSLKLSADAFDACLATHDHPDHVGGLIEYLSARNVLGKPTNLYLVPSVLPMFHGYAGTTTSVKAFNANPVELVPSYDDPSGKSRRLRATPFPTSHLNVGPEDSTRGIILTAETLDGGCWQPRANAVLLGDTEYRSLRTPGVDVFEGIRSALRTPSLRLLVLHIGSSQLKEKPGGHLYLTGLIDILKEIDHHRESSIPCASAEKLLVLVSEWGLEHATRDQVLGALEPGVPISGIESAFDQSSLLIDTIEIVRASWELKTIVLLAADFGLWVGLESGRIYIDGVAVSPEEIRMTSTVNGLVYGRVQSADGK